MRKDMRNCGVLQ